MATGTVKVWSKANGFGWIQPDSGGNRLYVHKSGVERRIADRAAWLEPGEKVEYQIGQREKGPAAINVKAVDPNAAASEVPEADADVVVEPAPDEGEAEAEAE